MSDFDQIIKFKMDLFLFGTGRSSRYFNGILLSSFGR